MNIFKKIFPKRIAIEFHHIGNRNVGIGEFNYQLAKKLAEHAQRLRKEHDLKFYFIVPKGMKGHFGEHVNYIPIDDKVKLFIRFYPVKMDLFHVTHQYSRVKTLYFARKKLLTIHDINFMYEKAGDKQKKYADKLRRRLDMADHLSYISNFAKQDVEHHFAPAHPSRVIYNGVTDLGLTPDTDITYLELPENYLFHISSLLPKKNVHLLIEMMRFLPEEHLVIVGSWDNDYAEYMKNRIQELNLTNVTTLDNVSNEEKAAIFRRCKSLLFPSLCEGFGLPPLEAMHLGKPVFLSTATSLPEVGGPEAFYWESLEPEDMAQVFTESMELLKKDTEKPERLKKWVEQFDWDRCAEQYIDYYLAIIAESHKK